MPDLKYWIALCVISLQITFASTTEEIEQVTAHKHGVEPLDQGLNPYGTWTNRRLHTIDLWLHKESFDQESKDSNELAPNKWYSIKFFKTPEKAVNDEISVVFSWNLHSTVRSAFTYLNFVNEPLGPETVRYEITTTMFDISNATFNPVNDSIDYTKVALKLNATHIMLWANDILALKIFLRDIPQDLGDTKAFKFLDFEIKDLYKIYYWDPTVFCWTDCYDDELPDKFHFDRDLWTENRYSQKELGEQCKIVNCTAQMGEDLVDTARTPSEFPRCVRLHHTPQGEADQKTLLKCTNENYTYTACEAFPGKPCWYEVCDNYDLCNSALSSLPSLLLLTLNLMTLHR